MSQPAGQSLGLWKILRGSLHLFTGHVLRLLVQSAYFVVITRGLGAEEYGRYTGVQALLLGLVAFSSLGYQVLALRAVARDSGQRAALWSGGLWVLLVLGGSLTLAATMLGPLVLSIPFPRTPLLLFAVSELLLYGTLMLVSGIMQGMERLDRMATIEVLLAVTRLAAVGGAWLAGGLTLGRFATAHAAGSLVCLVLVLLLFGRGWAWPLSPVSWADIRANLRDGFYISLSASGRSFLVGIDKMALPALAGLAVAGQYAAGFRVFAFAMLPIQAFMAALYPRFFQQGQDSLHGSISIWRRTAPVALLYAVPVSVVLFLAAPLLGPVLGSEYPEAPTVLRYLVWLLILQALYLPLGDALAGADRFGYRSVSILIAVIVTWVLCVFLIPRFGWRGAVLAVYSSQFLLLLLYLWGARDGLRGRRGKRSDG
ncbi:MAG: oligosaccharide flippase family protein [Candidatus Eisenbacteria bacterium]